MGIPSYFSYIVKNHIHIIQKYMRNKMNIHNLYLDCNSIIYDAVRNIDFSTIKVNDITTKMISNNVITKIEEYISTIQPCQNIIIAFDGVAPVAKLEQQRGRRYKSWYQTEISKSIFKNSKPDVWNTTAITPGTIFMKELNDFIIKHFNEPSKYNVQKLIVSTSNECGEGEHKIFDYIRNHVNEHFDKSTVIYGLDADLIMLSINHLPISPKIYLYRETPEFIKSIDNSLEPNESYLLDIPELARIITSNMNNGKEFVNDQQKNRIYDYIFMCFFLGNDFMPHFPALNIRTGGIDKLLNAYKETIGNSANDYLTDGITIQWKFVRKLVAFLVEREEEYLQNEMKMRDKMEKKYYPDDTPEQKYVKFDAIPTYERELEKYIHPFKKGWQNRYYKALFKIDVDDERRKQIATNYLEGLEWTMKYYTHGCADWNWCYKYSYPPLLEDLITYIPYFETQFIKENAYKPVHPLVQLCYVLPENSLVFLPEKLYQALKKEYSHWYKNDCEFIWAFSKYFWESHVELPEIEMDELKKVVGEFLHNQGMIVNKSLV
jgi:5'-3' exonuclease